MIIWLVAVIRLKKNKIKNIRSTARINKQYRRKAVSIYKVGATWSVVHRSGRNHSYPPHLEFIESDEKVKFVTLIFKGWELVIYDAIWLTENGQRETRYGEPSLYGCGCESVLIMNPLGVLTIV
jgi:hypothetical protein